MTGLVVDGCAGPGGPAENIIVLDLLAGPDPVLRRIASRITEVNGCWEVGYARSGGYVHINVARRRILVHRYVYSATVAPIEGGLFIDHLCRNRACCRPSHLEPVTNKTNILRGESPPAKNARKEKCPQGHEYSDQADGTRKCNVCRYRRRIATGQTSGRGRPKDRTSCPKGHPFDDENTRLALNPDGSVKQRKCRECERQQVRARRAAGRP